MAEIVLGIGTSHSPMLNQPADIWPEHAKFDLKSRELAFPPSGNVLSYETALERADPAVATLIKQERFDEQHARCQAAIAKLAESMKAANPDVVVIISDDQDELFFEDNMPMFSVYWGDTVRTYKRNPPETAPIASRSAAWGFGDDLEIPVRSDLGRHIVDHMVQNDFDVSHFTYFKEQYGGKVVRRYPTEDGETDHARETQPRRMGLPHGYGFVVKRIMENNPIPLVPIFQNTCYPPNQPTPRRCYAFGKEIAKAIASWEPADGSAKPLRVAVVASGGLSHFTVDEEMDLMVLNGLEKNDAETLQSIPRNRLHSAASEALNWVTLGGVMSDTNLPHERLDYLPVYRTPAATGGGWAFVQWTEK
ncbi:MAG: hypothetical protein WD533_02310 [Dehalococcoidia bacterium]